MRRLVDGMLASASKRVLDANASARDAAAVVARNLGVRPGEVRAAAKTAGRLEHLPLTDAAVRAGSLSAAEAQLIAAAASVNPDAERELLDIAEHGLVPLKDACIAARARVEDPAERSQRQRQRRHLRMWTNGDGMIAGYFELPPEVGGPLKTAIDAEVQRIFRERKAGTEHESLAAYAVDALAEFVLGGDGVVRGVDATVHILIDHGALLRGGAVDGEVCEIPGVGPVDVSWVTELLGSAFLTAVIRKGKDIRTVAHLGRHVPAEVMTALTVTGRECDVAGCNHRGYLERDHVHDHAKGGPTSFENMGWLCYLHHRLKSSGWLLGPRDPVTRKRTLREPMTRAA